MDTISITELLARIEWMGRAFFRLDDGVGTQFWLSRLVTFIVSDPLIMAVASFFFIGVVVAFFMRVYHSIL